MDILTLSYGVFGILVIASGLTAKLCKGEYTGGKSEQFSGFWIFEADNFTEKGKKLRRIFFLASNMSLVVFFAILVFQESVS